MIHAMIAPRIALAIAAFSPLLLAAQPRVVREAPHHLMVGSSDEDYLWYLQIAGLAALYPWSLREFSQPELARMAVARGSHPWSGKEDYTDSPTRRSFSILPVNAVLRFNSAFPYGSNDGAVLGGARVDVSSRLWVCVQVRTAIGHIQSNRI